MHDAIERYHFGEAVELEEPAGFCGAVRKLMSAGPEVRAAHTAGARAYAASMDARRYMSQFQ
jgi:hypothetical protein